MALRLLTRLRHRARALFRGQSVDHDLDRELRSHLDEEVDALVAQRPDSRCRAAGGAACLRRHDRRGR